LEKSLVGPVYFSAIASGEEVEEEASCHGNSSRSRGCKAALTNCTMWYVYQVVREEAMKKQLHVEAERKANATPQAVWSLVSDASSYCRWGIWSESGWVASGPASPGTPGSLRQMRYRRTRIVEQVLEVDEGARMTYAVVRGIPVRNYKGEVTLTGAGGGTDVRWVADWDDTFLGRIVHRKLSVLYPEIMRRLVAAAEQIPASTS
jgi:hypothetical protein